MLATHPNEKLILRLFDNQPDSVVWFLPVFNEVEQIIDFEVQYCNATASRILNAPSSEIVGSRLLQSKLMDEESIRKIFDQSIEVWNSDNIFEFTYHSSGLDRYFNVQRSKVLGGVLSITRDRTYEVKLELDKQQQAQKIEEQAKLLKGIIDHSPYGVSWYESVRDETGEIIDFRLKLANEKCAEITAFSLEDLYKYSVKELIAIRTSTAHFFGICANVVTSREPFYTEYYSQTLNRWMAFSIVPFDDGYILNYIDVTETKNRTQKVEEQANFLNKILDGSINGLFALEAIYDEVGDVTDFKIVKINKSFTRILGLGEEIIGKNYLTLFPATKPKGIFDLHLQVLKTGIPAEMEFYYNENHIDGWFKIAITKSGDNSLIQTFTDITESMRYKLSLEAATTYLQNVIDSAQTGIFLASPLFEDGQIVDFRFKTVNKALAAYAAKEPPDLIGGLHGHWFPVYKENGVFEIYKKVCETGVEQRFEKQYNAGNFDVWMDVSAKKIGDDLLVTFHDYTSLKKLQLQLETSVDELKKSNERLHDFAHVASHDLKEPLRKVRMHANMLEERFSEALGEGGHNHLLRIQDATIRMQALITDLLAYSQVSRKPETFEKLALHDLVHEVLRDLEISIQNADAVIHTTELPKVKGNATQLRQLFQNLLSNALKFKDPARRFEISIKAQTVDTSELSLPFLEPYKLYNQIIVADNGIGFDQQYADKVFKIFQRLHSKEEYEGTGIGLAIVQKVVENHQGFIKAESNPGKGAQFTIYLPAV